MQGWDIVSKNLTEALDEQTAKTKVTLFRLGELMSMSTELKAEYGSEPNMAYGVVEATSSSGPYSFALEELMPAQSRAEAGEPETTP